MHGGRRRRREHGQGRSQLVEGEEGTKITVPTTETEFIYSGPFQTPSDTSLAFWSS